MVIGGQTISTQNFRPNPAYPCDQTAPECPNFGGGLALRSAQVDLPDAQGLSGGLHLPGNVRELVLFPSGEGTGFFACTVSSCDVYVLSGAGLRRIRSGAAVPGREGEGADTSAQESVDLGVSAALIVAPGDLEVRALTPTGAAYSGLLSIVSKQDLTVGSSLLAQRPVCTTYPVRNERGDVVPAVCDGAASGDGLGLISERGNVVIGQPGAPLVSGDESLSLQAAVLAPRGRVSVVDSRLGTVDWIGSVTAAEFRPDARMRLAHDPRALNFPGFPALARGLSPARLSFDLERGLD